VITYNPKLTGENTLGHIDSRPKESLDEMTPPQEITSEAPREIESF